MKKKTTYKELFEVVNVIGQLKGEETKLTKKCVRFMKNIKPLIEDYNDAITVINEEFALTDDTKKGAFILDEKGSYTFNKEVNAKRRERFKELSNKEVDVDIVDCTDKASVEALDYGAKVALNGFLFNIELNED